MNFKLILAIILLSIGTSRAFGADTPSNIELTEVKYSSAQVDDYWTEDKIKNAKPMSLSAVNAPLKSIAQHSHSPSEFSEGLPPRLKTNAAQKILYQVDKTNESSLPLKDKHFLETGPLRFHFTSSRLIPSSANTVYPYATIGKLFFTIPNKGDFVCSASVLRQRIIFTAGHCVHSGLNGKQGFYQNFMFVPAFRDGVAPFGLWKGQYAAVHAKWATGNGIIPNEADYGMIELKDKTIQGNKIRISELTGFLGYQTEILDRNHAHLLGYPCNLDHCEEMHQVIGETGRTVVAKNVEYGSDMREGSDGSPWVQNFGEYGVGQEPGLNPGINRVIGAASYFYPDPLLMVEGGSGLDNRFITLLNKICSHNVGNCS